MSVAAYDLPDYNLTDTYADEREAIEMEKEQRRSDMKDEMLGDDGDLSEVIERLNERADVLADFMRHYMRGERLEYKAQQLAAHIEGIMEEIIEEQLACE